MKSKFAVFLDIDGVLNSPTTCKATPQHKKGVDDLRIEVLAKAIGKYKDTVLILSSDWKDLREDDEDYEYLVKKLADYGLKLVGKTEERLGNKSKRGEGIMDYLDSHPEIIEFVVLDDNEFDFENYSKIWDRLLLTCDEDRSGKMNWGIEHARYASKSPAVETMIFLDYIKGCR